MQQTQRTLKNDLKKFGLNPVEWTIEQLEEQIYQIAHIEDQKFYFLGEVQQGGLLPEWKDIRLFSL